jgi:branched-chain amino acid transport system substrate-binding protein
VRNRWLSAGLALTLAAGIAGCGSSGGSSSGSGGGGGTTGASGGGSGNSSGGSVVVGATIPLTGSLAAFGKQEQIGDNLAVAQINAAGGVTINGKKEKVVVDYLDNQSQPNLTTTQARTLVLQDHAVALFGNIAPPLVIPESQVADQLHVPFVHHTPIQAWLGGSKTGWKYAWDVFFFEPQMTTTQFLASDEVATNKKVVLFTDTDPDGIVMGKLWAQTAPKYGYTVVAHESFPEGTTDFSNYIQDAQSKGAQVLIAQMIPPDAATLWKQMKAAGYVPKTAFCEKCSYQSAWGTTLGSVANGTMVADIWSPAFNYPDTKLLLATAKDFGGKVNPGVSGVASAFTCAKVLLDAIVRAGATSGTAINAALAKTDGMYPVGHVKFNSQNYSPVKAFQVQWRNGSSVIVWPKIKGGSSVQAPVAGLQ